MKEILSNCCAIGGDALEVHALKSDCPIKRVEGAREKDVTCYYRDSAGFLRNKCEHFRSIDRVKRKGKTEYKITCSALQDIEPNEQPSEVAAEGR